MRRIVFLMLVAIFSISAFAEKERKLPAAYTDLRVNEMYGYRRLVFVTEDPLSHQLNYVFECVTDSTENASHMFYELVIPEVVDSRHVSSSTSVTMSGTITRIEKSGSASQGHGFVQIFLGYTKEQATKFFATLNEIKETRPLNLVRHFKGDYSEKIYRFYGYNRRFFYIPEKGDKDDVYIRYVKTEAQGKALLSKASKFFLFRSHYTDKAYIEGSTVDSYIKAIEEYTGEATEKAACVYNDISKIMDFSGVCNYKKIGTRKKGFNWQLDDFHVYEADNPQYEDERFHVVSWYSNTCDVFPIGKSVEDANSNIDAMEEALVHVYENKMGWYVKKQIIKHELHDRSSERFPDYKTTIGDVDFTIEGYTREKLAQFKFYRPGGDYVIFNRATLEDVRKAINKNGNQ